DFFRFHESIFPDHLGVNEKVVQLAYVGLILFGMFKFRKPILETDFLILLVALGFFGLSVVIDVFEDQVYAYLGNWKFVFEHGAKFLGIVGWFGYFFRCCILRLKPTEAGSNPTVTN
ncbi:MAG: hypothetical protein O7C75_14485, partial [Verrucomicrobia bacterium]|nr:hypothetical protein [Verrucomicrobiota bacterium]